VLVYNTFFRRNYMPIYEYQCQKCGTIEEALQKFSDKPLTKCRHCTGKLHKLVSKSSFHLKGTGWYVTDYKNQSKDAPGDSKKKKESADSKKPDKKAEPAQKTSASAEKNIQKNKGANSSKKP
jgi:putative FmdB family regulatory protein